MAYKDESYYKYYIIYKTTCNINNKFYIGQHRTNNLNDTYLGSGKLLNEDINKYGPQNFTKEILFVYDNFDDMNNKEIDIVTPEFVAREDTYNMIVGGQIDDYQARQLGGVITNQKKLEKGNFHSNGWENKSEKEIQDIHKKRALTLKRKYNSGELINPFKGKHHSKETIEKIKLGVSNKQKGVNNSQYGKHWWTNPKTGETHPFKDEDVPDGWIKGRLIV